MYLWNERFRTLSLLRVSMFEIKTLNVSYSIWSGLHLKIIIAFNYSSKLKVRCSRKARFEISIAMSSIFSTLTK